MENKLLEPEALEVGADFKHKLPQEEWQVGV